MIGHAARPLVLLAVIAAAAPPVLAGDAELAPEVLTLEDAVNRALANNPTLLASQQDVEVARGSLREARSLYYPKVDLNLSYVRYRNETFGVTGHDLGNAVLEAPLEGPERIRGNPLAENLYLGRLGFEQTLWAGGRIRTTLKLSKANVKRAENAYEALRKDVKKRTKEHFIGLLAHEAKLEVVRGALAAVEAFPASALDFHGEVAAGRRRADLRKRIAELEGAVEAERMRLLHVMGVELFGQIEVRGDLDGLEVDGDFQSLLAWAKESRDELEETLLQEEVDQLSINLTMAERFPVFRLGGGYERRNRKFPLKEENWNAVVNMNIPVFDGFSRSARLRQDRSRAKKGRLRRVELEDRIEKEVREAFAAYRRWSAEVENVRAEMAELDRLASRYQAAALRSSFKRLEFLVWRADARLDLIEALHRRRTAYVEMERAVGRPLHAQ